MPGKIVITAPLIRQTGRHVIVSADYLRDEGSGRSILLHRASFRFEWTKPFQLPGGEAFVTLGLVPAMRLGLPVFSEAPVAPGFAAQLERLQDIMTVWFGGGLKTVGFTAPVRPLVTARDRGTAAFFSGGVDSFHTAKTRRQELTHLLFIDGFDIDLHQATHRIMARSHAEQAASELGLPLVIVETDARFFLDKYENWHNAGGTVAGAISQLFAAEFGRVHFGSSHVWRIDYRSSASFLLVNQFGLADQEFSVDAMGVSRQLKVAGLAECPSALRHLRVCWEMPADRLNCGRCEKCLRTMVALNACGLLGACRTLPPTIDWQQVSEMEITKDYILRMWNAVRSATTEPEARSVLDTMLRRAEANVAAQRLWKAGKDLAEVPGWPVLARKLGKPLLATAWQRDRAWYLKKCRQHLKSLRESLFAAAARRAGAAIVGQPDPS